MGRWVRQKAAAPVPAWHERIQATARTHGAMPYVVEGFVEISEAVRRGHAVLVRRMPAQVADGVTIFERAPRPVRLAGSLHPADAPDASSSDDAVVAILRFNTGTARFVLQDADGSLPMGGIELTPRRLQRYLDDPERSLGVALGA